MFLNHESLSASVSIILQLTFLFSMIVLAYHYLSTVVNSSNYANRMLLFCYCFIFFYYFSKPDGMELQNG